MLWRYKRIRLATSEYGRALEVPDSGHLLELRENVLNKRVWGAFVLQWDNKIVQGLVKYMCLIF